MDYALIWYAMVGGGLMIALCLVETVLDVVQARRKGMTVKEYMKEERDV